MRSPIFFLMTIAGLVLSRGSFAQPNLVVNPGAEDPVTAPWVIDVGGGACFGGSDWRMPGPQKNNYPSAHGGGYFFNPGCKNGSAEYRLYQDIDVSSYATMIDAGKQSFDFSIWMSVWGQNPADITRTVVKYLSSSNTTLDSYDTGSQTDRDVWTKYQDTKVAPAGTRKIRIILLGSAKNGNAIDAYFDDISLTALSILPVSITDFNVILKHGAGIAGWTTASEDNCAYFELQRSADFSGWTTVSRVYAAGNASITRHYEAVDKSPLPGQSYYRLNTVDKDGASTFSKVITISKKIENPTIRIYPNPSTSFIFAEGAAIDPDQLSVVNLAGVNVSQMVEIAKEAQTRLKINISRLPPGPYFLRSGHEVASFFKR